MEKVATFFSCIAALFILCVPAYSEPTPEQVKERTNLLLQAIENNNVEQAKVCIKLGADVNTKNNGGRTALMAASERGLKDMVELLIEAGAAVNAKASDGNTTLWAAVINGKKDVAELLIEKGADVNAKTSDGNTALIGAARYGHEDIVELLIKAGADVNAKDNGSNTALRVVAQNHKKDIAEQLIKAGADVNAKASDGKTALMIAAEENGNRDIAELLINAGADVNVTYNNGETLLMKVMSDRKYKIAELLVKAGADVNAKNSSGDTLLMQNVKTGDRQNVKFLIRMGTDVNAEDNEGITALTYAALYGRNDIAELLKADRIDLVTNMVDMVYVEGGTFQMGSTEGDNGEKPVHTVTVSSFYMSKYEVTQAEYEKIMGKNPSRFKGERRPVDTVGWYDAVNYCNMLSEAEGLAPCYTIDGTNVTCNWSADGYRLPTEAEWEYAARGGKYKSAYKYSGSSDINEVAWYRGNSGSQTHEIGTKKANALGIYDMSGNVWEWCWDWYDSYSDSAKKDPHGPGRVFNVSRVIRGGGWDNFAGRCACRSNDHPNNRYSSRGFRVVCSW